MERPIHLSMLTPEQKIFEGEVTSVIVPGEAGYFGVLADHTPMASTLKPGQITLREPSGQTQIFKSSEAGFFDVFKNQITLILSKVEKVN